MKHVDFVVAGNQFLHSEVLPYNTNVEVIPTSVDLSHYSLKQSFHSEGPTMIGWLGSSSTSRYLKSLLPTFEKLYQEYPHFQLKMVCDQFLESGRVPMIKKRWSSEEEQSDLESFDIGIMPLSNDLWSQGKCGLKILQYYSVGIPVICTPVGVNRDLVEDGVNGFWARDEEEWKKSVMRLIKEEGLRKEMGMKGRMAVEKAYSLKVNAPRILDVLSRVPTLRGCSD